MKISNLCKSYFSGLQEISNYKTNDKTTNFLAALKIISYFTVVIPLGFAAVYGGSLCGRVLKKQELSGTDQKVNRSSKIISKEQEEKSIEIVKAFEESIKGKSWDTKVFILVSRESDPPILILFDHTDLKFSDSLGKFAPINLFGKVVTTSNSVSVPVNEITSIEIMPKIGQHVDSKEKKKLNELGITFDDNGFIHIPKDKFKFEHSVSSSNFHTTISSLDDKKIVKLNTRITDSGNYCIIHWSDD